jgi:hypothetical protein
MTLSRERADSAAAVLRHEYPDEQRPPGQQFFPARIDEQIELNHGSAQGNHRGVRLDLRPIDRKLRNSQIQFRQTLDGVSGEVPFTDLL